MMKKTWIIILAVLAVILVWGIGSYNSLVSKDEGVKTAWSQVENNYQRRADLIPNLVATVKGYASHERETLEGVMEARGKAMGLGGGNLSEQSVAAYGKAQGEVSSALNRLLMVAENYPALKANENFLDLQAQLEGTENRIAEARRAFNEASKSYNMAVRHFPGNIIAGLFAFEQKGYFEADESAKSTPKVEF